MMMMMMMIIFLKSEGQNLNKAVPGGLALKVNTSLCKKVKAIYFCLFNRGGRSVLSGLKSFKNVRLNACPFRIKTTTCSFPDSTANS